MSKGSRPRPYSVSQETFGNNYDAIFRKKETVTPSVKQMTEGTCGCGRSPTGNCIGWHSLTEEMYKHQQMLWLEEQERKAAEIKDSEQGG